VLATRDAVIADARRTIGRRWLTGLTAAMAVAVICGAPASPASDDAASLPAMRVQLGAADLAELRAAANPLLELEPRPRRVVHVEGVMPTTAEYRDGQAARSEWNAIATLAAMHAASGERRYLERYAYYLSHWLAEYEVSGNPVDETRLGQLMLAFRLAGAALAVPLQQRMRRFACTVARVYTVRPPAERATSRNNWQSHRAKLAVMGAQVCRDPELMARAVAIFHEQIDTNLLPSGATIDFAERDAIYYVVFGLDALLEAATFAALTGAGGLYGYVGPQGQSLARSLEWLEPYARGERTHEEFTRSTVIFDRKRAAAGVRGFSGLFDPAMARTTFWLAARLDPRWEDLRRHLGPPPVTTRSAWAAPLPADRPNQDRSGRAR